ncbi:MAG: type II toxin-antitoxin system HicB family antitoxin [Candidatus Dormiibacterota bacterium]
MLDPDSEGGFTVTVPSLPGCVTQGESVNECLERVREAIAVYIEDLVAAGRPLPEENLPPQLHAVSVSFDSLSD